MAEVSRAQSSAPPPGLPCSPQRTSMASFAVASSLTASLKRVLAYWTACAKPRSLPATPSTLTKRSSCAKRSEGAAATIFARRERLRISTRGRGSGPFRRGWLPTRAPVQRAPPATSSTLKGAASVPSVARCLSVIDFTSASEPFVPHSANSIASTRVDLPLPFSPKNNTNGCSGDSSSSIREVAPRKPSATRRVMPAKIFMADRAHDRWPVRRKPSNRLLQGFPQQALL